MAKAFESLHFRCDGSLGEGGWEGNSDEWGNKKGLNLASLVEILSDMLAGAFELLNFTIDCWTSEYRGGDTEDWTYKSIMMDIPIYRYLSPMFELCPSLPKLFRDSKYLHFVSRRLSIGGFHLYVEWRHYLSTRWGKRWYHLSHHWRSILKLGGRFFCVGHFVSLQFL